MKIIQSLLFYAVAVNAATYTVTSLDDSGAGTLREAMLSVDGDDTIQFECGPGTITLNSSLPPVNQPGTQILGITDESGNNMVTIASHSGFSVFDVSADGFCVHNLNFTYDANVKKGGILNVQPSITAAMVGTNLTPNVKTRGENPLAVAAEGVLNLTDVSFLDSLISQIYVGGTLNIMSDAAVSYIIDGYEDGNVQTSGKGVVHISAPTGVAPMCNITALNGTLDLRGQFNGTCLVNPTATFQGNAQLNEINVMGFISPGSPGTLGSFTAVDDYNETVTSTLKINISALGFCSAINAQTAVLTGSLIIVPIEDGSYVPGTRYTFLTGGVINGEFTSVQIQGSQNLDITYHRNSVEIVVLPRD